MMRHGCTAAAIATALVATSPAQAQGAAPVPQVQVLAKLSDAEVARRAQAVIDQIKSRPELAALSVAVARGDHIIVDEGAGTADLESSAPADANTMMRIGSVTKQFTAAAIMKLHEQGKIGLDDSIAKYLPDFDTQGHVVTIRQLLTHTSGIPNYTDQKAFIAVSSRFDLGEKDVLKLIEGVRFDFDPGAKWAYSNANFFLLGMIVEKITGQSYPSYMEQTFFKPLGLTHTRYDDALEIVWKRARGYDFDPSTQHLINATPIGTFWAGGAGGLLSTAGDLLRWQIALTGGRAVSAASFQEMIGAPVKTGNADQGYGFGLGVGQLNGQRIIGHDGGVNGFNSDLKWFLDLGLRIAVISNDMRMPSGIVSQRILAALEHFPVRLNRGDSFGADFLIHDAGWDGGRHG